MSNYRDDTTDTAIANDATWAGLKTIADDTARVKELFILAIAALSINSAVASDELTGRVVSQLQSSAVASDSIFGKLTATNTRQDSAKASDRFILKQTMVATDSAQSTEYWHSTIANMATDIATGHDLTNGVMRATNINADTAIATDYAASFARELGSDTAIASDIALSKSKTSVLGKDTAIASDELFSANLAISKDVLVANDTLFANKIAKALSTDTLIANDKLLLKSHALLSDIATASDNVAGKAKFKSLLADVAIAGDQFVIDKKSIIVWLDDSATAADESVGKLAAINLSNDVAVLDDDYLFYGITLGNAWTANTDTWAMSRYSDLPINRLVVINGNLYGESKNGIYQMDTGTEIVNATIETGKIDFGEALAHPTGAYLEYELNGSASMQVKTTQSGKQQAFRYPLPRERADELTNGRILFGRGLRGRHFTFVLNISATHGYLNSLAINALSTKRRV